MSISVYTRKWQPTTIFLPRESPWTEEPGRLQSVGSHPVRHDWATMCTHELRKRAMTESSGRCPFREGGQRRFISWDDIWAEARPRNKKRQECRHEWGHFQAELQQAQRPQLRTLMCVKTEVTRGLELRGRGESGWRKVWTILWGSFYLKKAN